MANAGISSVIAGPQSTRKLRYPMLMIDTGQCKNRFFLPYFHLYCDGVLPSFSGGMPLFQRYKDREQRRRTLKSKKLANNKILNGQNVHKTVCQSEFLHQNANPIKILLKIFEISHQRNEAGFL